MYPPYLLFSEENREYEEQRFWFLDSLHRPEVEMPFETRVGDRLVRGRIDAIFADDPARGFDVVDWKTGRPPRPGREERAVAVQLAAYRLAWAALAGVPVTQVRAAFYYVREDLTVRPADLLDAEGLADLIESVPAGL
jgi:DNA helicase-2/ATP-dependent DNA helicase PcrA